MIRRDYHKFKLHEALCDAEDVINAFRMNRRHKESTEDAEFIVGHGVIRIHLIKLLESHGLSPTPQLGNDGVILCLLQ